MGTYPVPAGILIPPHLVDGFVVLDPALCSLRGKGMDPWLNLVSKCSRLVALTSGNIVTAGVDAELKHAHVLNIEILCPWLTESPKVLSIAHTVTYNRFGTHVGEPGRGFCIASPARPGYPQILPYTQFTFAVAS
jgi:hypothetical protein